MLQYDRRVSSLKPYRTTYSQWPDSSWVQSTELRIQEWPRNITLSEIPPRSSKDKRIVGHWRYYPFYSRKVGQEHFQESSSQYIDLKIIYLMKAASKLTLIFIPLSSTLLISQSINVCYLQAESYHNSFLDSNFLNLLAKRDIYRFWRRKP